MQKVLAKNKTKKVKPPKKIPKLTHLEDKNKTVKDIIERMCNSADAKKASGAVLFPSKE